jgi:hypothetical protein
MRQVLSPITFADLKWGKEISFKYEGMVIDDGLFICMEDDGLRMRLMFAGSTFGRFEIAKVSELALLENDA